MAKILVVEDDYAAGILVKDWLEHMAHAVELVDSGDEAMHRLKLSSYDLLVVDWSLPGKTGLEVCAFHRSKGGNTPVLMLTSRSAVEDKTTGLYGGVDDYMTKPFDLKEFGARVTALLRRSPTFNSTAMQVGAISLDSSQHRVFVDGQEIHLLPKEFALLELFLKNPNKVVSAEQLIDRIWSSESSTTASVVKSHIYNLRKKIQTVKSPTIVTVHGHGYRLET